jgi:phage antirepressor YoqD-like protein
MLVRKITYVDNLFPETGELLVHSMCGCIQMEPTNFLVILFSLKSLNADYKNKCIPETYSRMPDNLRIVMTYTGLPTGKCTQHQMKNGRIIMDVSIPMAIRFKTHEN